MNGKENGNLHNTHRAKTVSPVLYRLSYYCTNAGGSLEMSVSQPLPSGTSLAHSTVFEF